MVTRAVDRCYRKAATGGDDFRRVQRFPGAQFIGLTYRGWVKRQCHMAFANIYALGVGRKV